MAQFKIKDGLAEEYQRQKNWCKKDFYTTGIFQYAEQWAELMEQELQKGASIEQIAEKTSHDADTTGITGFMYGEAVNILSNYWEYGENLRVWHNKKYGYNRGGIVNPAIMRLG